VAHCDGAKEPAAMRLENGRFLYLYNLLGLRREQKYLATLEYHYSYQATADPNSWIVRYDYVRDPPPGYAYATAHAHVNAEPASYPGPRPFNDLHLPTGGRVKIEQLLRHLIEEHSIRPLSPTWQQTLDEAEAFFDDIQRKRVTAR
jgi:hypothetical protein